MLDTFVDEALILSSIFDERYVSRCAGHLVCWRQLRYFFLPNDRLISHFVSNLTRTQSIIWVIPRARQPIIARRRKQSAICFALRKFLANFCRWKHHLIIADHGTFSFLTQISGLKPMENTPIVSIWLAESCNIRGSQLLFGLKVEVHRLILTKVDICARVACNTNLSEVTSLSFPYSRLLITFLCSLEPLQDT